METTDKKHTFIERRAQGYSFDKIAKELKISKVALLEWAKEFEDEIINLRLWSWRLSMRNITS